MKKITSALMHTSRLLGLRQTIRKKNQDQKMWRIINATATTIAFIFIIPAPSHAYDGCGVNRTPEYYECHEIFLSIEKEMKDAFAQNEREIECGERCQGLFRKLLNDLAQKAPDLIRDPKMIGKSIGKSLVKIARIEALLPTVLSDGSLSPAEKAAAVAEYEYKISLMQQDTEQTYEGAIRTSDSREITGLSIYEESYTEDDSYIDDIAVAGFGSFVGGIGTAAGVTGLTATTGTATVAVGAMTTASGAGAIGAGVTIACGPVCWVVAGTIIGGAGLWWLYDNFVDSSDAGFSTGIGCISPCQKLI